MRYVLQKTHMRVVASLLDVVGGVWSCFGRRKWPARPQFRKVLLIRMDHMGDVLYAASLPKILKEQAGCQEVHFLTNAVGRAVLAGNPYVDRVWPYEPRWFSRGKVKGQSFFGLIRQLRAERFDLVVSLRGDLRENYLAHAVRPGQSIGYGITGGGFFLTRCLDHASGVPETEHTEKILRSLGVERPKLEPKIYFDEGEERALGGMLTSFGLKRGSFAVIQLDAGNSAKEWPLSHWQAVLDGLRLHHKDLPVVFVGSSAARASWLRGKIEAASGSAWIPWVGRTSVRELFYLLREARFFVGADSGPAHVAMSWGTPTLILYSGTNRLEEWERKVDHAFYLKNDVPCSPCRKTLCPVEGHPCMSGIRPEAVLDWIGKRNRGH